MILVDYRNKIWIFIVVNDFFVLIYFFFLIIEKWFDELCGLLNNSDEFYYGVCKIDGCGFT